jgi:cobalamin biosynthetic protein CobC
MLEHGGQLRAASMRYGIALSEWLDLSTGINPTPFVPPALPLDAWSRLPQEQDGLEQAAANYFGTQDLLPVAGSQAAIQALPRLRSKCRVGVLHPGYAEHAQAWRSAGHEVSLLSPDEIDGQLARLEVLVLMQPNNPTGVLFAIDRLQRWHAQLSARGGWLVVDEAFVEASNTPSLIMAEMPQGLIVLRSLGKFFGLAGARVGFAASHPDLLSSLHELLGPWCIAGPARHVARAALLDHDWQSDTSRRLQSGSVRLAQLLRDTGLAPAGGCALFRWVKTEHADSIHQQLAQTGIFTRYFADPHSLRFGLPGSETEWSRLEAALVSLGVCA